VKGEENGGGVLPATNTCGGVAKRAVSERVKILLNGCEVRDVEHEDNRGEEWYGEVKDIKPNIK
jgi:hypothetical protein